MTDPCTRIVKVGGSLLDLPDLGERVEFWLNEQPRAVNVLVAGGAWFADGVRAQSCGDDRNDHWACIVYMDATAKLLSDALPRSQLITDISQSQTKERPLVLAPWDWMRERESSLPGTRLPESWDVTSDSIAARLAICIGADELVLLKSADPPSNNLVELAEVGYVDKFLPKLERELPPWRCVNLRGFTCDASHRSYSQ